MKVTNANIEFIYENELHEIITLTITYTQEGLVFIDATNQYGGAANSIPLEILERIVMLCHDDELDE